MRLKLFTPKTQVRVIGPPRSGTNFAKFLLDNNTKIASGFNVRWWKHAVIPPLIDGKQPTPDPVFSVILFRGLVEQMVSFWRFSQQGAGAVMSDAPDFSAFLREPMQMRPYAGATCYFQSPLAYIAEFYWAAHTHHGDKIFVGLEDLQDRPAALFDALSQSERFRNIAVSENVVTPEGYMGRNADKALSGTGVYDRELSLDSRQKQALEAVEGLSADDLTYIQSSNAAEILGELPRVAGQ